MPIYEFQCEDCKLCFDKLCSMKENLAEVKCAGCGGKNIKKKISSFATSGKRDSLESGGSSCSTCSSGSCSTCNH